MTVEVGQKYDCVATETTATIVAVGKRGAMVEFADGSESYRAFEWIKRWKLIVPFFEVGDTYHWRKSNTTYEIKFVGDEEGKRAALSFYRDPVSGETGWATLNQNDYKRVVKI